MEIPPPVHRRRPRYAGTHPRRFDEKYKELDPDRHGPTVQKVLESGKTPAGSHRPICVAEIQVVLEPKLGETAVDATIGHGGHAETLLPALLPGGRLIGLDTDPIELPKTELRLRALGFTPETLVVRHTNFAALPRVLAELSLSRVSLILADLGVSSMQLDNPERGFSCKFDGPLDLRMNPRKGRTAAELLKSFSESELLRALQENADEPHAKVIASALIKTRSQTPITRTLELAAVVKAALAKTSQRLSQDEIASSVRRVFQAIRIAVNQEFSVLDEFLRVLPDCLSPGGRVAILTFHSGEDRRVKKSFEERQRDGIYEQIADTPIRPTPAEVRANPRAASAKLRWARRRT